MHYRIVSLSPHRHLELPTPLKDWHKPPSMVNVNLITAKWKQKPWHFQSKDQVVMCVVQVWHPNSYPGSEFQGSLKLLIRQFPGSSLLLDFNGVNSLNYICKEKLRWVKAHKFENVVLWLCVQAGTEGRGLRIEVPSKPNQLCVSWVRRGWSRAATKKGLLGRQQRSGYQKQYFPR